MTNEKLKTEVLCYLNLYEKTSFENTVEYNFIKQLLKRVEELELILSGKTFSIPEEVVKELTKTVAEECVYICSQKACDETECNSKNCFDCIQNRIKEKYNLTEGENK